LDPVPLKGEKKTSKSIRYPEFLLAAIPHTAGFSLTSEYPSGYHADCKAFQYKNIEEIINRSVMAGEIRVLYVDDEPELLEMAKIFLEMSDEFKVGTSTSATEVLDIPLSQSYDAIISDYQMPVMNGIAFLKYVRQQFGDIPFILFTGRGREEVVIDAINNGADFYIQKGGSAQAQFAELTHKIRQAVTKRRAQAELKDAYDRITASEEELARSELQLQESESKFRDFADHLPQMVFETDMELRITYVNKYTIASYGFPPGAIGSGISVLTFIHPSQHARFMECVHHLRYGIPFEPREYTAFNKDGIPFPVIIYSSPIFRNKRMMGFRAVVMDISERKHAETALRESEEKHRTFAELLPQIVFETDCSLVLSFVNNQAYTQFGYTPEEVASGFNALTIIEPSQHERLKQNIASLLRGEPYTHEEYTLIRKDGTTFPGFIYADPVYRNGQLAGFRGIIIDTSEQKLSEQALRDSEQKYRTLVEVIQDIVYSLDARGKVLYISPQVRDQLGYDPDEIAGSNFSGFIHPDDARVLNSHLRSSRPVGCPLPQDRFRVRRKDGMYRWYEDKSIRILDMGGEQVTIGTVRDITERKLAEEAVFQSQQMLQGVLDAIPQRVFWKDRDSRYLGGNRHFAADVGFSDPSDIVGKTDYDHSSSAYAEHFRKDDREVIESGQPKINIEEPLIMPDGSNIWLRTTKVPLRNRDGEIIGVLGTYDNITEHKKALEALRESEEKYRDLTDRLPQMIFETDRDLRITYANRLAAQVSGFSVEELVSGTPVLSLIKPSQHVRFMESVKNILAGIPYEPKEYTAIRKDGNTFPVVVYSSLIYKNKEIVGFRGVAIDISGLRKMEAGIRDSEEKFRSLVENASDIVFSVDRAGNFTYISPQWKDLLGHDPERLIGTLSTALIHPDDVAGNIRAFRTAMEEGTRISGLEYRIRHKDTSWRWHSQSAAPVRNASGKIVAYQGICHDITKRKQAEKALRKSEAHYRLLADNVKDVIWAADIDMRLTYVSPSIRELRGMTPEEVMAEPIEDALTPESLALLRKHRQSGIEAMKNGDSLPESHPMELEFRRKDGSTVWTEVLITPAFSPEGTVTGVIGITRDISQRRESETALRESENKFATIFRNSQVALTLLSVKDNTFFDVNDAFVRNSGYTREEMIGRTPWDIGILVDKEDRERIASILRKQQHVETAEVSFRGKDGDAQTGLYSANLITMRGELFLLSSVIDITERKNAEEALRQANRKLNILSGITRHDINNQLHALGGYVGLLRHRITDPAYAEEFSRISATINQISNLIQFTKEYEMIGVHEPVWQGLHDLVTTAGGNALPEMIRLENELPENLEIFADPLISKVFFNLLDNAKRHGGRIRHVRFTMEERNGDRVIACSDDGVGVPPEDKERIFAPGVGRNTGFGLAISREILDITGIMIRETGRNGSGARFEIIIPAGKHRITAMQ
jgi:PAS domain S-box-containing protein